jgi:hypothetical protein
LENRGDGSIVITGVGQKEFVKKGVGWNWLTSMCSGFKTDFFTLSWLIKFRLLLPDSSVLRLFCFWVGSFLCRVHDVGWSVKFIFPLDVW